MLTSDRGMVTHVSEGTPLMIRGAKRKASQDRLLKTKRLRSCASDDAAFDLDHPTSQTSDSDDSASETYSVATLLTPQSPNTTNYPSNEKKIPCTFPSCPKLFNRQAKLEQHLRSHTNTRPFTCPHPPCTKAYLRDSHLKHHIKSIHARIRDYICPRAGCGKAFLTGTRFRRHIASHEEKNTTTCSIPDCGLVFRKHSTLEAHIRSVHHGIKPYTCQFLDSANGGKMCGMGFDKPAQLRSHEGRMHARNSFECTVCPSEQASSTWPAFPTYGALQEHMRVVHPPTCEQCGMACTSKSALKSHVEVKHGTSSLEERRQFVCPEPGCARGFTKRGNMNAHVRAAHECERYVCGSGDGAGLNDVEGWDGATGCGREFGTRGNLRKHVRSVHLGVESGKGGPNRKVRRKKGKRSAVARITGASDEVVSCLVRGCGADIVTQHDLEEHLQDQHGLALAEIEDMMAMSDGEEAVFARPALQGEDAFATNRDLEAEAALDMLGNRRFDQPLGVGGGEAERGVVGGFWLGGEEADGGGAAADEWVREEEEMRQLINDEIYGEDGEMEVEMEIDPTLI